MVNLGEESTRSNWSHYTSTWVFHSVNVCQVINEHSSVCYNILCIKFLIELFKQYNIQLLRNNILIIFLRFTFNINIWQSETISRIIRLYLSCLCKAIWHRDACILPPHFRRLKKKFFEFQAVSRWSQKDQVYVIRAIKCCVELIISSTS